MLKTINEWARDNNHQLDTFGQTQPFGMETLYDEEMISQQINGWLAKLTGLCSPVPMEDRPELVEQIVKAVRRQLLN